MEKYIISEAYFERIGVLGSLLRLRTECGRSVEMFLQHRDKAIERAGVKAYRSAAMSMDLPNIQDAAEFMGCEIHPAAWRQIEIEAEGDGKSKYGQRRPGQTTGMSMLSLLRPLTHRSAKSA